MRLRLELRHLQMLRAVIDCGGVTRGAERLGVTQSALTHRIREAERRLGTALFTRSGRRLAPTPAGERLHAAAGKVLEEIQRAEQEVLALGEREHTIVRLGQATYSRYHWLPEFIQALGRRAADIEIDLVARATHQPFQALVEGAADVVIVQGARRRGSRLHWFSLGSDELVAIVAPAHPLAARDHVLATDFVEERYITYSFEREPGFEWESVMAPAGVQPRRMSLVQVPEAIIDLVRAGFGVSILSRWAVEPEVDDGTLVARPITATGVSLQWWAVIRADEERDSPTWRVAEALRAWNRRTDGGLATLGFRPETGDMPRRSDG